MIPDLSKLGGKFKTCILVSPPARYSEAVCAGLGALRKKGSGLYICLNRPCHSTKSELEGRGISIKDIYFIDASGASPKKDDSCQNCMAMRSTSLTELSLAITAALGAGNFSYCVFDSLDTMLTYGDFHTCRNFTYYLLNKFQNNTNTSLLVMATDAEESGKMIREAAPVCDAIIGIQKKR